jgi:predicted house-cleaning noncanonical NTP pyrophosphatase (MazG superfamily)/uracil-DNA glycosylase
MRKTYNKLIRDRIPEILDGSGVRYDVQEMREAEYLKALRAKVVEEAREVSGAPAGELTKEIADLLEVLLAFQKHGGVDMGEVERIRKERLRDRGGFERRLKLLWTEDANQTREPADERVALLQSQHMLPLVDLVCRIRADRMADRDVPWPDPRDGGTNARLLILLEAPGPKAVNTGFISTDNPDPTARNLRRFLGEAGIPRSTVLLWNVVPWFLSKPTGSIKAASAADIREAQTYLHTLLAVLPCLDGVLLLGRNAQRGWDRLDKKPSIPTFRTYHTSNQVFAADPSRRTHVLDVLRQAADQANGNRQLT